MKRLKFIIAIFLCNYYTPSWSIDFYVSTKGNDSYNGLSIEYDTSSGNGPFLSLNKAQQSIRQLKKLNPITSPITVHIAPGLYKLAQPLLFNSEDSGSQDHNIVWQSDSSSNAAIISGGKPLTHCQQKETSKPLWTCSVKDLALSTINSNSGRLQGNHIPNFNLFINGTRMHLARWPNTDWVHVKTVYPEKNNFNTFESIPNFEAEAEHVQVHIYPGNNWIDQYLPAQSQSAKQQIITLDGKPSYPLVPGARFYIQNILSQLDAPGEWFFNEAEATISFIPPISTLKPDTIVVSSLSHLLEINHADHLVFRNITFKNSIGTAITINDSEKIAFDKIEIGNVDTNALIANNSTSIKLTNSHIFDTGTSGVQMNGGDIIKLKASGNLIKNNYFNNFGSIIKTYSPAINVGGVGTLTINNLIEDGAGNAVTMSGNNHVFEKNEIRNVCKECADCGAFYAGRSWAWRGNTIKNNNFHDISGYGLKKVDVANNIIEYSSDLSTDTVEGIYLDDGLSGFNIIGNIFKNAGTVAILIGGGRDNLLKNNIIMTEFYGIYLHNRGDSLIRLKLADTLYKSPYRNNEWISAYPNLTTPIYHITWPENNTITNNIIISSSTIGNILLKYIFPFESSTINSNMVWNTNENVNISWKILDRPNNNLSNTSSSKWEQWLSVGLEKNSIKADPCATIQSNKVSFCDNSPRKLIGFKNIPSDIGLQPAEK